MNAYVVESDAIDARTGVRMGTARVYVATEERAKEIASQAPGRTYRSLLVSEMPEKARKNLEQSQV